MSVGGVTFFMDWFFGTRVWVVFSRDCFSEIASLRFSPRGTGDELLCFFACLVFLAARARIVYRHSFGGLV